MRDVDALVKRIDGEARPDLGERPWSVREHTRAMHLSFAATVAKVTLLFEVFLDRDVNIVRLECTQEIVPVVVRYDKQSVLDFPRDGVRDDAVVQ